ncbi:hypothetical protein [Streptomyces sp. NBC_01304]|uniref:hypothetical protein n=1 Tax=Streptomyces sp. NBC_01304 TaxID=2903818 RepID=UPI002E0F5237|nr:hypothetical protein OG430_03685 [Streptomyces sp. NBC_01304]
MGAGILLLFPVLLLYCAVMAPFCGLVGARSTRRVGWLMAAGLMGLPLGVFGGWMVAAMG